MPSVACPSCGERGKIPPSLIGSRIKCKKCGIAFVVSPPATKPAAGAGAEGTPAVAAAASPVAVAASPIAGNAHEGIVVEGLDASAWAVGGDHTSDTFKPVSESEMNHPQAPEAPTFEHHESTGAREYKILCSRDKIFEGKFDLPRLEEVLNHYARQGWVVKSMSTPHLKGFSEGMKEEIVVLLERSP